MDATTPPCECPRRPISLTYGSDFAYSHIARASAISFPIVICCISPSLLQCPPKSNLIDAIPAFASSLASAGIGTMFPLEKIPCIRITIGHLSTSGSTPSGSVTSIAIPPSGP